LKDTENVCLAILIDSFRYDMLGPDTPFLSKMAAQGITGSLEPPLSYCLHPTWFAGLNPESSGKFLRYIYSPGASPYRRLVLLSFLERNRILRIPGGFARHHLLPSSSYGHAPFISSSLFKYFDISEKVPPWDPEYVPSATTLFDILKKKNLRWLFIGSPGSDQRAFAILEKMKKLVSKKLTFVWLHFAELDWSCHTFGPESKEVKAKLKDIDETIEKIYLGLTQMYSGVNSFMFGDHGHIVVDRKINIEAVLKKSSLRNGVDYVSFFDSTIARFWFRQDSTMEKVGELLSQVEGGSLLSKDDLVRFRLNLPESERGQLTWVADRGAIILPNFWQGVKPIKGMHGYLSGDQDNCSRFVAFGPRVQVSERNTSKYELIDIFPTLLDLMGLPTPSTNQGRPILRGLDL